MKIVMRKGKIIIERIMNDLGGFEMKELEPRPEAEIKMFKKKEYQVKEE